MAEPGALSFEERMSVIEKILFDLELQSRQANTVDAAVDIFAFGVGKVVARLRLEIDVARESRDLYRNKRDQLRDMQRKESLRSLPGSTSDAPPTPSSDSERSINNGYAALACQPELLDDDPPPPTSPRASPAGPFRRSVASVQRAGTPVSPRLQPQPAPATAVPSKPSRANKAELKPTSSPSAPKPISSAAPPMKPTKAAKQDLQPRSPQPSPGRAVAAPQHYVEFKAGNTYVDLMPVSRNTLEYGQFEDGEVQSEFGEFPDN